MKNHRTPTGKQTPDLTGCVFHYLTVMSFAGYEKAKGYWTNWNEYLSLKEVMQIRNEIITNNKN